MKHLRIEKLPETILVGKCLSMSLSNDRTQELWKSFMPFRKEILNTTSKDLFCVQVYQEKLTQYSFTPNTIFNKWACVAVSQADDIPENMSILTIKGGLYAVFLHVGPPSDFPKTIRFIHSEWLPQSEYEIDHREHFEILGEKYKNNDPSSEEEVWIPIRKRQ